MHLNSQILCLYLSIVCRFVTDSERYEPSLYIHHSTSSVNAIMCPVKYDVYVRGNNFPKEHE